MPVFEVEMQAFANGAIRRVNVPDDEYARAKSDEEILELIFKWGQNDFQPQQIPSVSCGDVVRLKGKRYVVTGVGFEELKEGELGGLGRAYPFLKGLFPTHFDEPRTDG